MGSDLVSHNHIICDAIWSSFCVCVFVRVCFVRLRCLCCVFFWFYCCYLVCSFFLFLMIVYMNMLSCMSCPFVCVVCCGCLCVHTCFFFGGSSQFFLMPMTQIIIRNPCSSSHEDAPHVLEERSSRSQLAVDIPLPGRHGVRQNKRSWPSLIYLYIHRSGMVCFPRAACSVRGREREREEEGIEEHV